ncbi:MAG: hypothetical protein IPM23_18680 [Candidatus Melainabacteria bacterium]|nr:hypothetical protein [Candidatus Melainabacteria bacterium]
MSEADRAWLEREPVSYLSKKSKKTRARRDPGGLLKIWGRKAEDIDRLINHLSEPAESFEPALNRREFKANIWREVIDHPWDNELEELAALLIGAVKIGCFGDSDGVYATIFRPLEDPCQSNAVYLWSHETYYTDEVLALSPDVFAYQADLVRDCEAGKLSGTGMAIAWAKLAFKIHATWAMAAGLEESIESEIEGAPDKGSFKTDLDPRAAILRSFWRGQWIAHLLREDDRRRLDDVKECFRPSLNPPYTQSEHESELSLGERLPATAIYLLWRYFWFDQKDRLAQCVETYKTHYAPVVRDLVELIEDLENGGGLQAIKDLSKTKAEFLRLDLVPEGAERRRAKEEEQRLAKSKELSGLQKDIEERAAAGAAALLDLAYDNTGDPESMEVIEKYARTAIEDDIAWRILDSLRSRELERGGRMVPCELAALAEPAQPLLPFLYSDAINGKSPYCAMLLFGISPDVIDRDRLARLKPALLRQLKTKEEFNHRRTLAVTLLDRLGAPDTVPDLSAIIEEFLEEIAETRGFDLSMAIIPYKDLLISTTRALAGLARPGTIAPAEEREHVLALLERLARIALDREGGSMDLAVAILEARLAWGETDLRKQLGAMLAGNDTPEKIAALDAIEKLAPVLTLEQWNEFLMFGFDNPDEGDNAVTLMHYRAGRALLAAHPELGDGSESDPADLAYQACLEPEVSTYGEDRWKHWWIIACQTAGMFEEMPLDPIRRNLENEDPELRAAAFEALAKRGGKLPDLKPLSHVDIWQAEKRCKSEEELARAIHDLLTDPYAVARSAIAGWLWEHPSAVAAAPLARLVEKALDSFEDPGAGASLTAELDWLVRALARHAHFEGTAPAIKRCLAHANFEITCAVIDNLENLSLDFAPQLFAIAKTDEGWRRAAIAKWALSKGEQNEMATAIKGAGLNDRKLKAWTQ